MLIDERLLKDVVSNFVLIKFSFIQLSASSHAHRFGSCYSIRSYLKMCSFLDTSRNCFQVNTARSSKKFYVNSCKYLSTYVIENIWKICSSRKKLNVILSRCQVHHLHEFCCEKALSKQFYVEGIEKA